MKEGYLYYIEHRTIDEPTRLIAIGKAPDGSLLVQGVQADRRVEIDQLMDNLDAAIAWRESKGSVEPLSQEELKMVMIERAEEGATHEG